MLFTSAWFHGVLWSWNDTSVFRSFRSSVWGKGAEPSNSHPTLPLSLGLSQGTSVPSTAGFEHPQWPKRRSLKKVTGTAHAPPEDGSPAQINWMPGYEGLRVDRQKFCNMVFFFSPPPPESIVKTKITLLILWLRWWWCLWIKRCM